MLNPKTARQLAQALAKAAKMNPEERRKRVQMVKVSGRIYHAAAALSTKAKELDHPKADEALAFLAETKALELSRVWEPTEGQRLLTEIQDLERELKEIDNDDDDAQV